MKTYDHSKSHSNNIVISEQYKNIVMFENKNLSLFDLLTMIQAVCARHNLNDETRYSLYKLVDAC